MMQQPSHLRILVVDDQPSMREMLRLGLSQEGHIVSDTDRGAGALESVRRRQADLILLDLGLTDMDGLQVIKRIRYAQSYIPIIVLSNRGDETAKVAALDLGADDYITKPFGIEELLARIRVLQRYRIEPRVDQAVLQAGELTLNLVDRGATVRGVDVTLSPREYELLRLFVAHPGKVLTHEFILRQVWGTKDTDVQYLRIYIRALRQKIEQDREQPSLIVTESGIGYRLRVDDAKKLLETSGVSPAI
jgi:two-component system, OmpR family, KDP operon response regulator KdpE